ncbi:MULTISPECIES: ABC transporter substrate-binding protein [unclassified Nonomuraea]|uniref:ABC transporter substrate-binding protein n=1 Tax=unclassified Nonomuraea TaxID=2593643 RepID=UPI0034048652
MSFSQSRKYLAGLALASCLASAACGTKDSGKNSDDLTSLELAIQQPPSLGFFLSPIIKDQGLDKKHGLNISFKPQPGATYRTNFASGATQVGASGTLLTDVGLLSQKGGKVQYLFNVYNYWGAAVAPKTSGITKLSDFSNKSFAADLTSAQYVMFKYVAQKNGLDVGSMRVQGVQGPALSPIIEANRADGVEIWEPAYSSLTEGGTSDKYTTFDLAKLWTQATGQSHIPYLGLAAQTSWITSHKREVSQLYDTYVDAAAYVKEHPTEAAQTISKALRIREASIAALLKSTRLNLNVYWASSQTNAIDTVFRAAVESGYLKSVPQGVVYQQG